MDNINFYLIKQKLFYSFKKKINYYKSFNLLIFILKKKKKKKNSFCVFGL